MAQDVKIIGRVRSLLGGVDAGAVGDDEQLVLNQQKEQIIALGGTIAAENVKIGRAFQVSTTAAVAAVVAPPASTVHGFSLYNGEPDGGRSYVLDWIAAQNAVTVTGVAAQAQMLGLIGQVREAVPANSVLVPKRMNGLGSSLDTKARTILTGTALPATTGATADWFPIGPSFNKIGVAALTTAAGYGGWFPLDGRIIVPPGRYFAMHVQANATGETFQMWIAWHEKQLTLG